MIDRDLLEMAHARVQEHAMYLNALMTSPEQTVEQIFALEGTQERLRAAAALPAIGVQGVNGQTVVKG